jgi:hypothetical protein
MEIVAAHKAVFYDQTDLLRGRVEGEFVVSYETSGGWVAITKDILTEVLGAGRDAKIVGLPCVAAGVLKLMCPDLVVLPGARRRSSRRARACGANAAPGGSRLPTPRAVIFPTLRLFAIPASLRMLGAFRCVEQRSSSRSA